MKSFVVPETIEVMGARITFAEFVTHLIETDDRFNAKAAGIRSSVRIDASVNGARVGGVAPGDTVSLLPLDHAALLATAEEPTAGYPVLERRDHSGAVLCRVRIGRQLLSYIDAIRDAKDTPP